MTVVTLTCEMCLHVQQLGQAVSVGDLPRVQEPEVHAEDEDPADVVPYGGHLEDGVGHQPGDVDDAAEDTDDQHAPSERQTETASQNFVFLEKK